MTNPLRGRGIGRVFFSIWMLTGVFSLFSQTEQATFLLARSPAKLDLLNRFEQRLNPGEARDLLPLAPIRITAAESFLSDGFTPCLRGELRGKALFILRDETEGILNKDAAEAALYPNCAVLGDTISILRGQRILLRSAPKTRPGPGETFAAAEKDSRWIRVFAYRDYTLLAAPDYQSYHWAQLPANRENRDWGRFIPTAADLLIPEDLREAVAGIFGDYNQLLLQLYQQFNRDFRENLIPPGWEISYQDTLITATFADPQRDPEDFAESRRYLINQLENRLLGSAFALYQEPRRIRIRRKNGR